MDDQPQAEQQEQAVGPDEPGRTAPSSSDHDRPGSVANPRRTLLSTVPSADQPD